MGTLRNSLYKVKTIDSHTRMCKRWIKGAMGDMDITNKYSR